MNTPDFGLMQEPEGERRRSPNSPLSAGPESEQRRAMIPAAASVGTQQTVARPANPDSRSSPGSSAPAPQPRRQTIPNASVGIPYKAVPQMPPGGALIGVQIPDQIGLHFDATTRSLKGTPTCAGEFELTVEWTDSENRPRLKNFTLLVNPDPKTLWRCVEPAPDASYRKPHLKSQLVPGTDYRIAVASRRGRSHEHSGSFRDDDFYVHRQHRSGWSVLVVADGAGSAKYSRRGSRIAATTFGVHVMRHLRNSAPQLEAALERWDSDPDAQQEIGRSFYGLLSQASKHAVSCIEAAAARASAPARDYSTTLLAAAAHRAGANTFIASFWMGDGAIAAYLGPEGVKLMGSPDSGEYAGQTRFLDQSALRDPGFAKRISIGRYKNLVSLMLMTDGVSDPRFETDVGLTDVRRWNELWQELIPSLTTDQPDAALTEWLGFFTPGHHDDRTIAVLW